MIDAVEGKAEIKRAFEEVGRFADETGIAIHVRYFPPGTSKGNKTEHRMFCHITQTWRGRPLTDRIAIVELIGATPPKRD